MHWLFAALAGIGFVELFMRLPVRAALTDLQRLTGRIMAVLRSGRISDHWKEKILPVYAGRLFRLTVRIALCLLAAFVPLLVLLALAAVLDVPLMAFTLSWAGIVFTTLVALVWAKARSAYAARTL